MSTMIANNRRATIERAQARAQRSTLKPARRDVEATFEVSRTTNENKRHFADADSLSGRAAYYKSERKTARERSRLEAGNNSWYAGMLRTAANHIIGIGPQVQWTTSDRELNRRIGDAWSTWSKSINLVEKLRVAVETYWRDGEVFAMRSCRPSLFPVTLDIRLYEPDQVAQPYWHVLDPTVEDGKRVDQLGNAVEYWIYDHHPGDLNIGHVNLLTGHWYPAEDVVHLYRAERPGQLRGFPRCAPALDWLAHIRRFAKATLSAAEKAALWSTFVKTTGSNVTSARLPQDWLTVEIERDMMNFLPEGWEPAQLKAEHPTSTNESYQRSELTYFTRCSNMPYSLAAGTSKDSNFSAAKMDIKNTWEPEVRSEQTAVETIVMAPAIRWFMEDLFFSTDILDAAPPLSEITYKVIWPPLPQSDEIEVVTAATERIKGGLSTPSQEAAFAGNDFETQCEIGARDFGATVQEYKRRLFDFYFPPAKDAQVTSTAAAPSQATPDTSSASPPQDAPPEQVDESELEPVGSIQ